MSDSIKHECGLGIIRLLKPLSYYKEKYGTALWGLNRMFLLMEKQHNRGQDGAGISSIKLNATEGYPYLHRERTNEPGPWMNLVKKINERYHEIKTSNPEILNNVEELQTHFEYSGELLMGHLRYGTHGDNSISACHPVVRTNNWRSRTLALAGNFNLTNVKELFDYLVDLGQHPRYVSDTETVLERIGHFLDMENESLFLKFKQEGYTNFEISRKIAEELDLLSVLKQAATRWDGGYVMGGVIGCGDSFAARDPHGIRPCFYHVCEEFVVVASERPAISTVFNLPYEEINELERGKALIIKSSGKVILEQFTEPKEKKSCSFERIYFSRGNDPDIYKERMKLGEILVPKILDSIDNDLENTVFSYIPNTAETSFLGMIRGVEKAMNQGKIKKIKTHGSNLKPEELEKILSAHPRVGKVIIKDVKLRTFITDDSNRDELVGHVYDVTSGIVRRGIDTLVCIDDSIVRGTTLKKSILGILNRLGPKKIIIVSSAPQIRYLDCYGIDMSRLGQFIAFQALIALLKETKKENLLNQKFLEVQQMEKDDLMESRNVLKDLYDLFTEEEISSKISALLTPPDLDCEFEVIYQPLSNLESAIPNHRGDWYFSGNFPTPGGIRSVNQAFINYLKGVNKRAYS